MKAVLTRLLWWSDLLGVLLARPLLGSRVVCVCVCAEGRVVLASGHLALVPGLRALRRGVLAEHMLTVWVCCIRAFECRGLEFQIWDLNFKILSNEVLGFEFQSSGLRV